MKGIRLEELKEYKEDREALKEFESSYKIPAAVGILGFVAGFILTIIISVVSPSHYIIGFIILAAGWLISFIAIFVMYLSIPRSRVTGKPMAKYRNISTGWGGWMEIIYVCHDSKTYFKRRYVTAGC